MYLQKIIKTTAFAIFLSNYAFAIQPRNLVDIKSVQKEVDSILDINLRQIESCADCAGKKAGIAPLKLPGLSSHFDAEGADCTSFIDKKGSYGPIGQTIAAYLNRPEGEVFLNNAVVGMSTSPQVCPKWSNLSKEERVHFWVWTMASLAWGEARCVPTARNRNATNGVGVGLFQLDERKSARYWRGKHCNVQSVSNSNANTLCALDIMSELIQGKQGMYKSNGKIYSNPNSYWEHLRRPTGGNMGNLIKRYPLCR